MKKIYRLCFGISVSIMVLLSIVQYSQNIGYNFIVINSMSKNSIVKTGTFLIFKECNIEDLKEYDIIRTDNADIPVARILKIDKKTNILDISDEEFSGKTQNITINNCLGKLVFHFTDYDIIYNAYFKPYKIIIMAMPVILLVLSMISFSVHRLNINNEDAEFMYYDSIVTLYNNKKFAQSYCVLDDEHAIHDKIQYDSSVNATFAPNFCLTKKEHETILPKINKNEKEKKWIN